MGFFYMINNLKVIFVIIGTLIGAGFASGKEIYTFFFSYGEKGIISIIISSILIGIIIYDVLQIINKKEIKKYENFLDDITSKNKKIKIQKAIALIINIFMLVSFYIMITGFGAYCNQQFELKPIIGSIILATICYIFLNKDIKGVILLNQILVPVLILFVVIIGTLNFSQIDLLNLSDYIVQKNNANWLVSGILYSSYNAILLVPVLITLQKYIKSQKQISQISISVTIITLTLSLMIFFMLVKVDVNIENLEMPVAYVISNIYPYFKWMYAIILPASILTTAISLGNSFVENMTKRSRKKIINLMCISSILVSGIGFSNLINILYPLFGYLGLIQILAIIIKAKKYKS